MHGAHTDERSGVRTAFVEAGEGRLVVAVHDVGGDAADWPVAALGGRAVAYSRRGYGGSSAPEGYARTTVEEQAEDLARLLAGYDGERALLLGDGFGALIALDAAKRHGALVAGLVLVDTPLHAFVSAATQALSEQRSALEQAVRDGGRRAAIATYLGPGADPLRLARAEEAQAAFFADYAALTSWPVTRRELRAIAVPAVVLTRPGAPAHLLAASDALAGLLPLAERVRDGDPVAAAAAR